MVVGECHASVAKCRRLEPESQGSTPGSTFSPLTVTDQIILDQSSDLGEPDIAQILSNS